MADWQVKDPSKKDWYMIVSLNKEFGIGQYNPLTRWWAYHTFKGPGTLRSKPRLGMVKCWKPMNVDELQIYLANDPGIAKS